MIPVGPFPLRIFHDSVLCENTRSSPLFSLPGSTWVCIYPTRVSELRDVSIPQCNCIYKTVFIYIWLQFKHLS